MLSARKIFKKIVVTSRMIIVLDMEHSFPVDTWLEGFDFVFKK